jgi:hypothetical protein
MKMALICKNDEFFVMPLKHVLSVMGLECHASQSDEFFATPLKNVLGIMGLVNHLGIPKL